MPIRGDMQGLEGRRGSDATARRLGDTYVSSVQERVTRFAINLVDAGFLIDTHDWSSLDALDDLWWWAQDHLTIFDDRQARFQQGSPEPWHPFLGEGINASTEPSWNGAPELTIEAQEFASGIAALFSRFAVEHWDARWVFGADVSADAELAVAPLLEIPRSPDLASARFGPVRVSPEHVIAASLRSFTDDPLWHATPPWHAVHARVRAAEPSWHDVTPQRAEEFHDAFVGGHLRRISSFRDALSRHGLDTTSVAFDDVDDLAGLWAWCQRNLIFAEQTVVPRDDHRSWMPELAQGAHVAALPRWTHHQLSGNTLTFASGLAACATEVALRSWGAEWSLGGRPGDRRTTNRTHLELIGNDGRPHWLDIEREILDWLGEAVVVTKRRAPSRSVWRRVIGETDTIAQFMALFEVPQAPWVRWHALADRRFADDATTGDSPIVEPWLEGDRSTADQAVRMIFDDGAEPRAPRTPATTEADGATSNGGFAVPPMVWKTEPSKHDAWRAPVQRPADEVAAPTPSEARPDARSIATRLAAAMQARSPFPEPSPMTSIAELAHLETESDESHESSPGAVESDAGDFEVNHEAVEHPGSDAAHIVVEPDDDAGPQAWLVHVGGAGSSTETAGAVERFARRLNRSRGIRSATRIDDRSVGVVTNRFGFDDLETVEALVARVWKQTMATQPTTAATS